MMGRRCALANLLLVCGLGLLLIIVLAGLSAEEAALDMEEPRRFSPSVASTANEPEEAELVADDPGRLLDLTGFRLLQDARCNETSEDAEDWELDGGNSARTVWIITSYAGDVVKRSALRLAYPSAELKRLAVRRVFLLGALSEAAQRKTGVSQLALEDEARRHGDIVQGNFLEAYRNLSYKHLMGLRWAAERCSDSYTYIMKMDDDIVIDLYEALQLLRNKSNLNVNDDFLMGYVMEGMAPVRNRASKWFVTEEEYPRARYPAFLSGWFYVIDIHTAVKLIRQSRRQARYFWIDDLLVTGILREEAGIQDFINVKDSFTTDYRFLECCLKDRKARPKYKCDYIVGPDGGDPNLLPAFKKYSEDCYRKYKCVPRPRGRLLKDKCILDYRHSDIGSGNAQVESLNTHAVL